MSAKSVRNRRRKERERQARKEAEAVVVALGRVWRTMRQPVLLHRPLAPASASSSDEKG